MPNEVGGNRQQLLGILLEALGPTYDQAQHAEGMAKAQEVFGDGPGQSVLSALGLMGEPGERVGHFWSRQFPRTMPPTYRQPARLQDIALPAEGKRAVPKPPKP